MERFCRTELLIDKVGLDKLKNSTVAVFGIGGVGSYSVEALARSGVGSLVLIDYDTICLSNINRQLQALNSTVGKAKVEVMVERIKDINSFCRVEPIKEFFAKELADKLVRQDYSYIVDAIDSIGPKTELIKTAINSNIPIISSMGAGNKLDPTCFKVTDISKTHTCPMAKAVRKLLRTQGIKSGLKVVFSPEPAIVPGIMHNTAEVTVKRRITGSISFVPSVAGLIMASVVINDILGKR